MHPLLRFTLDIFEQNKPLEPVDSAQPAIERVAVGGAAVYRHPRANREVRLCETVVAYEFKRGQRRTIGFSVSPDGLVVSAPKWVALRDVDTALQGKAAWIIRKLGDAVERRQRLATHTLEWRDGMVVPYLGASLTVRLDPQRTTLGRGVAAAVLISGDDTPGTLLLALPLTASSDQICRAVQTWLMRDATRLFTERLNHFAPQLQVQWRQLALSNAATRWGSARSDGAIRLNWRLMHFHLPVIDYVVAHELSHLREMNHSPRFWDTVRSVVPDYAVLRQQLKNHTVPRWT